MSAYDQYDPPTRERSNRRSYYRDDRDPRYDDYQDNNNYLRPNATRDLIPRSREDSDLSVEEIRRDFPPPGYGRSDVRRARSAEPGYYDDYDDRRSHYSRDDRSRDDRGSDRRPHKKGSSVYYEEEERKRRRVLSNQEKIIAAIIGGAVAIGGKELYDRREAKEEHGEVHRNPLSSAALGAAGAFAAYQGAEFYNKRASKDEKKSTYAMHKGRDGKVSEYYSDSDEEPKRKEGHKNFLESALAAAGLGGAVKALTGGESHDDSKSDSKSRRGSRESSSGGAANKVQKAAMASLIAGATEAFRVSKEPGGWKGEKAKRVLTAAAGAATIDAAQGQNGGTKLGIAESVIGGLLGNRLLNGSKHNIEEDKATGRSRSRSRARSSSQGGGGGGTGLAALATAGLGAFGAKKLMDHRSRSRNRSADSYDSRRSSPDGGRRQRSRSRSVVDTARRSLAKIGIGNGPDDDNESRGGGSSRRDRRRDYDDYSDDEYSRGGRSRGGKDDYDDDRSYRGKGTKARSRAGSKSGSESDLGDSSEDEKRAKKMRDRRHRH